MALPAIRYLRSEFANSEMTMIVSGVMPPFFNVESDCVIPLSKSNIWQRLAVAGRGFDCCFVNSIGLFDIGMELAAFVSGASDRRGPRSPDMSDRDTVYDRPFAFGEGHETVVNLRGAGGRTSATRVPYALNIPEADLSPADQDLIVVHAGSSASGLPNRWAPSNFARVARECADNGKRVILVGTSSEWALLEKIKQESHSSVEIACDRPLADVALLLKRAGCVVANDSGIGHLAASVGARLITIMGATNPDKVAPVGPNVRILGTRCPHGGCYWLNHPSDCARCVDLITPEEVLALALDEAWIHAGQG